jgi:hypothetical protein
MRLIDLERLKSEGKIKGWKEVSKATPKAEKLPANEAKGLIYIKIVLNTMNIPYEEEFKFLKNRKFRFDICIPTYMLYIEYEGLVAGGRGGHQTMTGYTKNTEKYNLACINGWSGLRYTAMNYKDFEQHIVEFLMRYK